MNIREIIIAYCIVHYPEADGLCLEHTCGCSFDNMQSCSDCCMHCVPAKWNESEEVFEAIKINE